ncbi:hypothetical protein Q5O14_07755 [Eubacteriaceae bacterium ES2]|nr:hypothetical protein Q5O14_07755 [Eubacteriaceae bacterium ES2]
MNDKQEISKELTDVLSFNFYKEMADTENSWIKQYEKETGKSAYAEIEEAAL